MIKLLLGWLFALVRSMKTAFVVWSFVAILSGALMTTIVQKHIGDVIEAKPTPTRTCSVLCGPVPDVSLPSSAGASHPARLTRTTAAKAPRPTVTSSPAPTVTPSHAPSADPKPSPDTKPSDQPAVPTDPPVSPPATTAPSAPVATAPAVGGDTPNNNSGGDAPSQSPAGS